MRRILLVLAVAALMAAMVVATAVPAFANPSGEKDRCSKFTEPNEGFDCRGGFGSGGGGAGGGGGGTFVITEQGFESTGGGGGGGGGSGSGDGQHCSASPTHFDCDGKGWTGQP